MSRKVKPLRLLILLAFFGAGMMTGGTVLASYNVDQTPLDGGFLFDQIQFTSKLPVFGPGYNAALPRVNAVLHPYLTVKMVETKQQVLPKDKISPNGKAYGPTNVWAYEVSDSLTGKKLAPAFWPGVTIETRRKYPTVVTYENDLPSFNAFNSFAQVQGILSVDPGIHWANPLDPTAAPIRFPVDNDEMMMHNPCMNNPGASFIDPYTWAEVLCNQPFSGPQPTVPHLHGAEDPSYYDGGPDAWFTSSGILGPAYSTFDALYGGGTGTGYTSGLASARLTHLLKKMPFAQPDATKATYIYDNVQEPGTLWFHDHALGATRINVYSGLEAFYFIRESGSEPAKLPNGAYEIEMAIQDRQFAENGQLYFPDGYNKGSVLASCGTGINDPCLNGPPTNPLLHAFWIPEFIGDVAVVNGAPWPTLQVEPRRYLFRLLDGSNARMYNLTFGDTGEAKPPFWVIGNDDNYLDAPAVPSSNSVFIGPGQRVYVIVDFSKVPFGSTVTLTNDAPVPFPSGLSPVPFPFDPSGPNCDPNLVGADGMCPADQPQMHSIMQFQVNVAMKPKTTDISCDPAKGGCKRPRKMVRLTDVTKNTTVAVAKKRQLILKEWEGVGQFGDPGGPIEVLVNNTRWDGFLSPRIKQDFPDPQNGGMSELPQQGSIEQWEIINLTADAHPMHLHLTQFQILNRQLFDTNGYVGDPNTGAPGAWAKAFYPGGDTTLDPVCAGGPTTVYNTIDPFNPCPEYGPPLPYNDVNTDGAIGGNPPVSPYLVGAANPPEAWENGWRDTAVIHPGEVMRLLVRWTPSFVAQRPGQSFAGQNLYTFDPTAGPGYVWHCHIVDHEDNEMMRPYSVSATAQ